MKKSVRNTERRRRAAPAYLKGLKWLAIAGAGALIVYGVTQLSGVAYNEDAIRVVDFSVLKPAEKQSALVAANNARCTCSCGMTLAQCVSTDSTCPIRDNNVERIKTMVREAARP
jgi:hypothetical protein